MSNNQSIFPFLPDNANALPQVLPYDLAINKAYPGIEFEPTEPNGQYQVIREVSGSLWLVTNADFNPNTLRWEQDNLCNPLEPAYALALQGDGSMVRYQAVATEFAGQPVNFVPLFKIDAAGLIVHSPLVTLTSTGTAETENLTWDAGTSVVLTANQLNIIDTASAPNSLVDAVYVNGTEVWAVQKDGTLVAGKIPFSLITGFTAAFTNASFTGTTTFNGPIVANGGITTTTLVASGSVKAQEFDFTSGGRAPDSPTEVTANFVAPAIGANIALNIFAATYFPPGTTVIVAGNSNATGAFTSFTGYVVATNQALTQPSTIITVQAALYQVGEPGDIVLAGCVVSYTTVSQISSPDGSLDIANGGTAYVPSITLSVDQYPNPLNVVPYTTVAVGQTLLINCQKTRNFAYDAYVMVQGTSNGITFLAQVIQSQTRTNVYPSMINMRVLHYFLGGAGTTIPNGASTITNGSAIPDPLPVGGTLVYRSLPTTSQGQAGFSGSLSALPFDGAGNTCTFAVAAETYVELSDGDNTTLTGSGASWANSPAVVIDSATNTYETVKLYGTATSGQIPSVTLKTSNYGQGQNPAQGIFEITAIRTA